MPDQMSGTASVPEQTKCQPGACKRFECRVIGFPRPSVRWFKDGQNVTAQGRYKFDYTADGCVVLVLDNVTARDQGLYECRAENTEGAAETSAQLFVKGKWSDKDTEDVSVLSFRPVETSTPRSQRRPLVLAEDVIVSEHCDIINDPADPNISSSNEWSIDTVDTSTTNDDIINSSGKDLKENNDISGKVEQSEKSAVNGERSHTPIHQPGDVNGQCANIEREDSSDSSADSVLGVDSEIQGSAWDKGGDHDFDITSNSNVDNNIKESVDGELAHTTDINNAQTGDDIDLNCVAGISTSDDTVHNWTDERPKLSDLGNRNEELNNEIEDLVAMDKSGDPHSRRSATDSGVASRGSSLSSDVDFGIATDSMLEMQEYLHGRKDVVYESFEHTSETTTDNGAETSKVTTEAKTSTSSACRLGAESLIEHVESEFVEVMSSKAIDSLSTAQADANLQERLLSAKLGIDDVLKRHNLANEQDGDFTWESIADSEQSVMAGKFLYARGPGIEHAEEVAHGLSEMETLQQHEESQVLAMSSQQSHIHTKRVEHTSSTIEGLSMQSTYNKTELHTSDTTGESTSQLDSDTDITKASDTTELAGTDSLKKGNVESQTTGMEHAEEVAHGLSEMETLQQHEESHVLAMSSQQSHIHTKSVEHTSSTIEELSMQSTYSKTELHTPDTTGESTSQLDSDTDITKASDTTELAGTDSLKKGNVESQTTGMEHAEEVAHGLSEMETLQQHEESHVLAMSSQQSHIHTKSVEHTSSTIEELSMQSTYSKTELHTPDTTGESTLQLDSDTAITKASDTTELAGTDSLKKGKIESQTITTEITEHTDQDELQALKASDVKSKLTETSVADSLDIVSGDYEMKVSVEQSMQHTTTTNQVESHDGDSFNTISANEHELLAKLAVSDMETAIETDVLLVSDSKRTAVTQPKAEAAGKDAENIEQLTSIADNDDIDIYSDDRSGTERKVSKDVSDLPDTPNKDNTLNVESDTSVTSVDDLDDKKGDIISNRLLTDVGTSKDVSELKADTDIANAQSWDIELDKNDGLDIKRTDAMVVDKKNVDDKAILKIDAIGKDRQPIAPETGINELEMEAAFEQPLNDESFINNDASKTMNEKGRAIAETQNEQIAIDVIDKSDGMNSNALGTVETVVNDNKLTASQEQSEMTQDEHIPSTEPTTDSVVSLTTDTSIDMTKIPTNKLDITSQVETDVEVVSSSEADFETEKSQNVLQAELNVVDSIEHADKVIDTSGYDRTKFETDSVLLESKLNADGNIKPADRVTDTHETDIERTEATSKVIKDEDADEDTTYPANDASHKRMHREEAQQGKLDYKYADDAEARLAAGRYLFYCAGDDEDEEVQRKETAHELHYWREAEADEIKIQSSDRTEMELPVKELTEAIEAAGDVTDEGNDNQKIASVGETLDNQVQNMEISAETGESVSEDTLNELRGNVEYIDEQKLASTAIIKDETDLKDATVETKSELMEQIDKQENASLDRRNEALSDITDKEAGVETESMINDTYKDGNAGLGETPTEHGIDDQLKDDRSREGRNTVGKETGIPPDGLGVNLEDTVQLTDTTVSKVNGDKNKYAKETSELVENKNNETEPDERFQDVSSPEARKNAGKESDILPEVLDVNVEDAVQSQDVTVNGKGTEFVENKTDEINETSYNELIESANKSASAELSDGPNKIDKSLVDVSKESYQVMRDDMAKTCETKETGEHLLVNDQQEPDKGVGGTDKPHAAHGTNSLEANEECKDIETQEQVKELTTEIKNSDQVQKETDIKLKAEPQSIANENEILALEKRVDDASVESTADEQWIDIPSSGVMEFKVNVETEPTDSRHTPLGETETSDAKSISEPVDSPIQIIVDNVDTTDGGGISTDTPSHEVDPDADSTNDMTMHAEDTAEISKAAFHIVEAEMPDVLVVEGEPIHIQWKIHDISEEECHMYKDGFKVQRDDRLVVTYTNGACALDIASAELSDEAEYFIRVDNQGEDFGYIEVLVNELEPGIHRTLSEPAFLVEPTVEIEGGRMVSIKCSVCGVPEPQVTWFIEGQKLGHDALWDTYSKDGFYHLGLTEPSELDCEEIVCRVENEAGFIQNVLKLKRDGYEISLEPVLPTAVVVTPEIRDAPPTLNLEVTESKERYKKLKAYILPDDHSDKENLVTFKEGEIVELLGTNMEGAYLARNGRQKKKIGYLPSQMMLEKYGQADDVRAADSQTLANRESVERKQIGTTHKTTEQTTQEEPITMPERRNLTASSPGLHGTPRKKPKDRESPSELDRRLGFKENLTAKKDDQVRLTEYEDGTTRPMFKRRLRRIVADEGQLSQLECVVSGTPQPKVLWLKNNRPLKASDGCQVVVDEESNILVFPKVSDDDAGVYTARAMNVNGSVMCTAELALSDGKAVDPGKEPTGTPMDLDFTTPAYFFQMSSCQVEEGRLARFDCRVVAYPKPEIVWMKDGKVVESEDRFKLLNFNNEVYSLLIQDVQHEDSGRYTCWARNKFGEAMTEAFLNVISLSAEDEQEGDMAPRFLTKFYDQQTTEGLEADFKCLIGGRPAPSVAWHLDDIELQDAPGVRLRRKDGMASLEVKSPTVDQSGQYTCHISNALGEATCSARLTVIENKLRGKMLPKFLKKFDHVTVREGDEATFTAAVVGEPKAKIIWMYNDKPLDASRRYVMKQDGDNYTLTVKNTRFDDSGKISCKAVNDEGEVYCYGNLLVRESRFMRDTPDKLPYKPESAKVDSKFGYIPTFTKRLQDTSVSEGGQAKLECKVMGIPEPEVTWMKDGRVIPTVGRYHVERDGETCRLAIDNVRPEDQGVYTCIVSNTQGKSSSSAEVKMAGAGKKDTYTPDRSLTDTYAKRPYGESPERFEALPKILATPKIPYDRPTLLNKRDDSVRLSWLPAPTHDLPKDGRRLSYTIESKEIGGPRRDWKNIASDVPGNSYNVRNLRPDREYEFRVRAQNQYGLSEPTRASTLEKRVDESAKYAELPEVRAPPRLPTHRPIITDMGDETVRLAWRPVEPYKSKKTPPVSYRLEAKELPGRDWMPMSDSLRDTTHYLGDLSRERDYMIRVRAENDFGVSEPTEALWLPRATAFPGVPISRPEIVELEPQRAKLSWSRVDVPTFGLDDVPLTYMLEAAEPPHDWRTIARDIDDTDYTVDGLKPGRDYRFRVRAKTPSGVVSEPSPAVSLYATLAKSRAPVDRFEVLDMEPETMSAHLGWSRVEIPPYGSGDEPLMYMIEYQEPPVDDWRPLVTGVPTNQYRVMNLDPERDYNFRVRALTPYGVSPPSATLPVSLRYSPASRRLSDAVVISDVDSDSLQLSWRRPMVDPSQDVSYQVQMLEQPLLDWRPVATGVTGTTYKVTGLRPKRDYQFRVIPQIGVKSLEPTPTVALTAGAVRPRLHIREPELQELGPESVQLSWKPAELPVYERKRPSIYYGVEKMELPSGTWVPAARRLTDNKYTVTGLKPDRDYKFRVTAETDTLSASGPSMAATLHRSPAPIFSRDEPVIRDLSPNVVTMSWQPATIPSGLVRPPHVTYNVEVQSPPGMSSAWTTLHAAHPTPSVRLADLRPDRDYLVRVRAQYDDHVTEPTLPVYIPRRAVPPRLPVEEPYVVDIQPNSVKLQWRSADLPMHIMDYSPISYRIEGREMPGGQWVTVARGVPHTDFTITGLVPDKDYEFRVKAENNYGFSDPTRPITLTKRAVAPVLAHDEPLIYDLGPGSARLSWRPATLPAHLPRTSPITYTIQVQDAPFKTWRPYIKRIPHTSYYVSGLDATKDYNFRVVADNDFGSSRPTQPVYMSKYADLHIKRPISMPEVDEFDDDLTSVKLHWKTRAGSPFDSYKGGYQIESWEPVRREWRSVARGIPGTSYHLHDLPKVPDHLFRVRMETDHAGLSEPSLPVSVSRYLSHPRMPIHRAQLYEVDSDSAMLSWQPVHVQSRRPVRYSVEQREIPDTKWRNVSTDILDTNCRLRSLRPRSDYEFRVRALIDGESTEPSFPVPLYRKAAIPRVTFDTPEVHDVVDDALTLRWNKVDVPAFSADDEPLTFVVERQLMPSYEWEPVATDITDSTYRVKGLQPYQDYSFRVRGLYPSGYTEPSPAVPVYRRPSESRLPLASSCSYSVVTNNLQSTNQKLAQQQSPTRKRPTHVRRSRRMSLPQIYEVKDSISAVREASFKSATPVYVPKFKMENAYVYNRKVMKPSQPPKVSQEYKPQIKKDVKPRMARRHSDVGPDISEWYARRPRVERQGYADKNLEERVNMARYSLATETHVRSVSLPKRVEVLEYEPREYRSVADRYEEIKCPYIMRPHMLFPHRRSSISLDPQDLEDLKKTGTTKFHSNARSRSTSAEMTSHRLATDIVGHVAPSNHAFHSIDDGMLHKHHIAHRASRNDMRTRSRQSASLYEPDYGYFAVSKFSLMVSGVRRPLLPSYPSEVSPSRGPSPAQGISSFRSRSLTPEVDKYEYTQRSRSLSQSLSEWNDLRKAMDVTLSKVKEGRSSSAHAPSVSITSVSSSKRRDIKHTSPRRPFTRPRSNSISTDVPLMPPSVTETTTPKPGECKFPAFKLIQDSRTLQKKIETFNKPKGTPSAVERRSSVTSEARFVSSIAITPTVKANKPQVYKDVKSDPRFTTRRRHSVADPTGDLLKHRLDSLNYRLLEPKSLRGSKKRATASGSTRQSDLLYPGRTSRAASGTPRGELPRSDKLAYIAKRLQT